MTCNNECSPNPSAVLDCQKPQKVVTYCDDDFHLPVYIAKGSFLRNAFQLYAKYTKDGVFLSSDKSELEKVPSPETENCFIKLLDAKDLSSLESKIRALQTIIENHSEILESLGLESIREKLVQIEAKAEEASTGVENLKASIQANAGRIDGNAEKINRLETMNFVSQNETSITITNPDGTSVELKKTKVNQTPDGTSIIDSNGKEVVIPKHRAPIQITDASGTIKSGFIHETQEM